MFGLIHTGVFFSLVPIFQARGLTEADAVATISAFAVSLAAMHLIGGCLADALAERFLLALGLVLLNRLSRRSAPAGEAPRSAQIRPAARRNDSVQPYAIARECASAKRGT